MSEDEKEKVKRLTVKLGNGEHLVFCSDFHRWDFDHETRTLYVETLNMDRKWIIPFYHITYAVVDYILAVKRGGKGRR